MNYVEGGGEGRRGTAVDRLQGEVVRIVKQYYALRESEGEEAIHQFLRMNASYSIMIFLLQIRRSHFVLRTTGIFLFIKNTQSMDSKNNPVH